MHSQKLYHHLKNKFDGQDKLCPNNILLPVLPGKSDLSNSSSSDFSAYVPGQQNLRSSSKKI